MKVLLIIISIFLFAFIMIQAYTSKSSTDIEQYRYTVIKKVDNVEIRAYASAVFSSVKMSTSKYEETANGGFRILAGYIFGGNDRGEKIAMTSPVVMEMGDSMKMSFMVPSDKAVSDLPKPNDQRVFQERKDSTILAAIAFGGWASDEKIQQHIEELKSVLNAHQIAFEGPFSYLGYNPPYQLVNRRNEVVVKVKLE
jgi:SOUL heme-binding protein